MAALHDVSKHDDFRLDPKANASDTRAQRDATNTTSIHPVTDATTTKGFLKTGSGQVLGNDGSNNIGLFGFDSSGNMVVKVAKSGFDADTASNANLIFNSSQNTFKIAQSGTAAVTLTSQASGATSTTTVVHNLGYTPAFMAFVTLPNNWISVLGVAGLTGLPTTAVASDGLGAAHILEIVQARVDSTNLYFDIINTTSATHYAVSASYSFKYYILQETAA